MPKLLSLLLALLLAVPALCALESGEKGSVSYYGAVMYDVPSQSASLDIRTRHEGMYGFYLAVPDKGPKAETFSRKAIRFTLTEPVPEGGFGADEVVTPASIEILGLIAGEVVEIGEDYVVSYVYERGAVVSDAPTIRLTIDENTYMSTQFQPGSPVYILFDEETETAYEIWRSNG